MNMQVVENITLGRMVVTDVSEKLSTSICMVQTAQEETTA